MANRLTIFTGDSGVIVTGKKCESISVIERHDFVKFKRER